MTIGNQILKMGARKVPICAIWRRERDSNPRYLSVR